MIDVRVCQYMLWKLRMKVHLSDLKFYQYFFLYQDTKEIRAFETVEWSVGYSFTSCSYVHFRE